MPYLFSSLLLKGVLISISSVVKEIIRQFSEIPYLWQEKARPDVIKSVDLVAIKSLEALKNPGIVPPITAPIDPNPFITPDAVEAPFLVPKSTAAVALTSESGPYKKKPSRNKRPAETILL